MDEIRTTCAIANIDALRDILKLPVDATADVVLKATATQFAQVKTEFRKLCDYRDDLYAERDAWRKEQKEYKDSNKDTK